MATPKVLTITLRFDMTEQIIRYSRIKAASDAVVEQATQAVQDALLDGSVAKVSATTTWAYNWSEFTTPPDPCDTANEDELEE